MGNQNGDNRVPAAGKLSPKTGVYIMKDARGKVIYVGKALNLRSRVSTYFRAAGDERPFSRLLREKVQRVDVILTETEKEALILENNLVKQFKPRYNLNLKDDKNFVCLKFDTSRLFPRLEIVRRFAKDGASYFGPYSSAKSARTTFRQINSFFPLRKCPDSVFRKRLRPCLNYQIHRCLAPCCGYVDEEAYEELVRQASMFLRGRNEDLLSHLRERMEEASEGLDFEKAAKLRDRIAAVEATIETQKITEAKFVDRDIFGYYGAEGRVEIHVMFVRDGRLEDFASYSFRRQEMEAKEVFFAFLRQFYSMNRFVADEVLLPDVPDDVEVLAEWLSEVKGKKVSMRCPKRGQGLSLVEMAMNNAENSLKAELAASGPKALREALKKDLGLAKAPRVVECFDVSNIAGEDATGACVRFKEGLPEKSGYRHYKIKTVHRIDDYSMLEEVLGRRFSRGLKEENLPDLALIDGGKGHLSVAETTLKRLGVEEVELAAIAKGRDESGKRLAGAEDRYFRPGRGQPIQIDSAGRAARFLRRVRDEAHRFAISYHRKLRSGAYRHRELEGVKGLGEARSKALFAHFGSFEAIRAASAEELASVKGISRGLAERIRKHLDSTI